MKHLNHVVQYDGVYFVCENEKFTLHAEDAISMEEYDGVFEEGNGGWVGLLGERETPFETYHRSAGLYAGSRPRVAAEIVNRGEYQDLLDEATGQPHSRVVYNGSS